jgi:hypothetical protein
MQGSKGAKERFKTGESVNSGELNGATLLRRAWKVKGHLVAMNSATKSKEPAGIGRLYC